MSYSVDSLEPKLVWKYFDKIRQIPRGSKNEAAIGEALIAWAEEKGFETDRDKVGNVVIRVPASKGCEDAPTVVLQGHMDMVCEKNSDKEFDFEKDPIVLVREGDWITADGTTLGADNGIGVAAGLAFLEMPDAVHGPLEILSTVDEETGLVGAQSLETDFLKGRMLFNLDSEEDGIFYVGCAGGRDSNLSLPLVWEAPAAGTTAFEIEVKGLRGGHSGLDVIQNRGNAIKLVARAVRAASRGLDISLASIGGGDKHNAIPREASAVVLVKKGDEDALAKILDRELAGFMDEFASGEPDLKLTSSPVAMPEKVLVAASRDRVMQLVLGIPHGVFAMVRGMEGMVETSSNMARVRIEGDELGILCATRSSVASALDGVIAQIEAVGGAVGADVKVAKGYPGWMPNLDSKMLATAKEVWKGVHGDEATFTVIHAGLECGLIGEKYPGMDMISLGPTIESPHSPDERVSIPTVARFFDFVKEFLASLARA